MKTITRAQVREAALKYKGSRKVNPLGDNGACVYTSKNQKRHCFAGQLAVDLGGTAPAYDNSFDLIPPKYEYFRALTGLAFSGPALELLSDLQLTADGNGIIAGGPVTWGQVVTCVIK